MNLICLVFITVCVEGVPFAKEKFREVEVVAKLYDMLEVKVVNYDCNGDRNDLRHIVHKDKCEQKN